MLTARLLLHVEKLLYIVLRDPSQRFGNPAGESDSEEQAISSDSKEQKKWRPQVSTRQRQQHAACRC